MKKILFCAFAALIGFSLMSCDADKNIGLFEGIMLALSNAPGAAGLVGMGGLGLANILQALFGRKKLAASDERANKVLSGLKAIIIAIDDAVKWGDAESVAKPELYARLSESIRALADDPAFVQELIAKVKAENRAV